MGSTTMKPTMTSRTRFRATTALCLASTVAFVSAAYAHDWGRSSWDKRPHLNRFLKEILALEESKNNKNGKGNGNNGSGNTGSTTPTNPANKLKTASPIKHVIVLIGENRGLDHTFGVYKPKGKGETISNLLSKGIVNEDGTPGPNFAQAQQFSVAAQPSYYIGAPTVAKSPYNSVNAMPQPDTNGVPTVPTATSGPFQTIAQESVEKDMGPDDLATLA